MANFCSNNDAIKRQSSPIVITKCWARSWSLCTGSPCRWLFTSSHGGRLPLLSARPAVTFPAKERHHPGILWPVVPSYTAWWQRHIGVNNLPKVVMQLCPGENQTHHCMTASPTLYCYATAPPPCNSIFQPIICCACKMCFLDNCCI